LQVLIRSADEHHGQPEGPAADAQVRAGGGGQPGVGGQEGDLLLLLGSLVSALQKFHANLGRFLFGQFCAKLSLLDLVSDGLKLA